jgi:hypothetical protein
MFCSRLWEQIGLRVSDSHVFDVQWHNMMCCDTQCLHIKVTESQNQVSYVMQACPQ